MLSRKRFCHLGKARDSRDNRRNFLLHASKDSVMARIIGAIACSHTPTIGFAFDKNQQQDPVWRPIFESFEPVRNWIAERAPDVMFVIYNDHITSFFFDHYSAF